MSTNDTDEAVDEITHSVLEVFNPTLIIPGLFTPLFIILVRCVLLSQRVPPPRPPDPIATPLRPPSPVPSHSPTGRRARGPQGDEDAR